MNEQSITALRASLACANERGPVVVDRLPHSIPPGMVRLCLTPSIFEPRKMMRDVPYGQTIGQMVDQLLTGTGFGACCTIDGMPVPAHMYDRVRPRAGHVVDIAAVPRDMGNSGDQRDVMRYLMVIGGGFIGNALNAMTGGVLGWVLQTGATVAALWLAQTLIPYSEDDYEIFDAFLNSSTNQDSRDGVIPVLLGRRKITPLNGSPDYMAIEGEDQWLVSHYLIAMGKTEFSPDDIYVGDQKLLDMVGDNPDDPSAVWVIYPGTADQQMPRGFAAHDVHVVNRNDEADLGYTDPQGAEDDWVTVETQPATTEITVVLNFYEGLGIEASDGYVEGHEVEMECQYRELGTEAWTTAIPVTESLRSDNQVAISGLLFNENNCWDFIEVAKDEFLGLMTDLAGVDNDDRVLLLAQYIGLIVKVEFAKAKLNAATCSEVSHETIRDAFVTVLQAFEDEARATFICDLDWFPNATMTKVRDKIPTLLNAVGSLCELNNNIADGLGGYIESSGPLEQWINQQRSLEYLYGNVEFHTFVVKGARLRTRLFSLTWPVAGGTYEVRARRRDPISEEDDVHDVVRFEQLISKDTSKAAVVVPNVAQLSIKIRASEEATGTLGRVQIMATSFARVWDGVDENQPYDEWPLVPCENPAWLYLRCLLDTDLTRYPYATENIYLPSFVEWADYCDAQEDGDIPPITFSMYVTRDVELGKVLQQIEQTGDVLVQEIGGKLHAVIDQAKTAPVAPITIHNSSSFVSSQTYLIEEPQAVDVNFQNEFADYETDTVRVCRAGYSHMGQEQHEEDLDGGATVLTCQYVPLGEIINVLDNTTGISLRGELYEILDADAGTIGLVGGGTWGAGVGRWNVIYRDATVAATEIEALSLTGATHPYEAFRQGHKALATLLLRREIVTVKMDRMGLVCKIGDMVYVNHPVPMWGIGSGVITGTTLNGSSQVTKIQLSHPVAMELGKSYVVRVLTTKTVTGHGVIVDIVAAVVTSAGEKTELTLSTPYPNVPEKPASGHHFMFGQSTADIQEMVIREVQRDKNFNTTLTLIHHAPEIYTAHLIPIPDFDSNITVPPHVDKPVPPKLQILRVVSDESVLERRDSTGSLVVRAVLEVVPPQIGAGVMAPASIQVQYRQTVTIGGVDQNLSSGWLNLPHYSPNEIGLSVYQVQEQVRYDFRARYVAANGMTGQWSDTILAHLVIGKTSPPQNVASAGLFEFQWLRWTYPTPPMDFRGFYVGYGTSEVLEFSEVTLANDTPILDQQMNISVLPIYGYDQPVTFYVWAVDTSGNLSSIPAIVTISGTLGETNVIETEDHFALGWTGQHDGTEVNPSGHLIQSSPIVWQGSMGDTVLPDGAVMSDNVMQSLMDAQGQVLGAGCYTAKVLTASSDLVPCRIFYSLVGASANCSLVWGYDQNGNFPLPQGFSVPVDGNTYYIMVRFAAGSSQGSLDNLILTFDVPDVREVLEDAPVLAAGTRLKLTKTFRKITTVIPSPRYVVTEGVLGVLIEDKDETLGPLVRCKDKDGNFVDGTVDFIVMGY